MAHASITRWAVAACFLLAALFPSRTPAAENTPAPFSYAWKIVFRGEEIGHALSRFSYRDSGGELSLVEAGTREFSTGFAGMAISFSQETSVVWDQSGLMETYVSRSAVGGRKTEGRAERRADGAVSWKLISEGEVKERLFSPEEFDYTDGDRFLTRLGPGTEPRTFRILSLGRGKVVSITYRFVGREIIEIGDTRIEASRVAMEGPGVDGTLSIDDLGIALGFTMEMFFGDFSFIPTGRQ
jgi:hypothetical protein